MSKARNGKENKTTALRGGLVRYSLGEGHNEKSGPWEERFHGGRKGSRKPKEDRHGDSVAPWAQGRRLSRSGVTNAETSPRDIPEEG